MAGSVPDIAGVVLMCTGYEMVGMDSKLIAGEGKDLPVIFGASAIGPSHVKNNIVCQDAWDSAHVGETMGVIALSDGLGSASMSDTGASLAVRSCVERVKFYFKTQISDGILLGDITKNDEILKDAVRYARNKIIESARELDVDRRDLACTIILILIQDNTVSVAQIGDGAVVGKVSDELCVLSLPGYSEYVNEVIPITHDSWEENLNVTQNIRDVICLAAFTDGCQRGILIKKGDSYEPFAAFFDPLFRYASGVTDTHIAGKEISGLLSSQKLSEGLEDDKTLVIALLQQEM
ncbi:MAG: PP2C family serine/threonine-protein phosphatase [Euryarchaeota archaeon]|nr:PP2C family serine/threonine-protein phosphatase [Euryarchaeota archaeon]